MESVDGASSAASAVVIAGLEARLTALAKERDEYKQLAELLQRELERLRDLQKTPREHVNVKQAQLAFAAMAEQLLGKLGLPPVAPADDGATTASGDGDGAKPKPKKPRPAPHGRGVLPEHLPVKTMVVAPQGVPASAVIVKEEVSWRLAFERGGFYRLKIVRPIYVVERTSSVSDTESTVSMHDGDLSPRAVAVAMAASATGVSPAAVESDPPAPEATDVDAAGSCSPSGTPADPGPGCDALGASVATNGARAPSTAAAALGAATTVESDGRSSGSVASTTLVIAAAPDEVIKRGLPTVDTLARVITAKFADKQPFNRQEGIYAREGVRITRGTMCNWTEHAHGMARLVVEAMIAHALAVARWISTDATGVLVQANERCKRGHFWVLVAETLHVIFRYSARHSKAEPLRFFDGYRGVVVADAASVFNALFGLPDGPDASGCNTHARRYFFKALETDQARALVGIGLYNRLFELERTFAGLSPDERLRRRQAESAPVVELLRRWRLEQLAMADVAEGSPIRKALNYVGNHWDALTYFLRDGHVPIHNNGSELRLRALATGRVNWLFVGSDDTAAWTCTFASLVASCDLHKLDPEAYLRDLFRVLPLWPRHRLLELSPLFWRQTRDRLDPRELALPIGPLSIPPPLDLPSRQKAAQ